MVNIPSNLQGAWDDVSKDGKIDQADAKKLLNAAAPGMATAKTAAEIEKVLSTEVDSEEMAFLSAFSDTGKGAVLEVKNGTAKGTFEFVDKNPPSPETGKTTGPVLFEPLKLPESSGEPQSKTGDVEKKEPAPENKLAEITDKISKLQELKQTLPKILFEPSLSRELGKIDQKIKALETEKAQEEVKAIPAGLNKIADEAIAEALKSGDPAKLQDAKKAVETQAEAIKNEPRFKTSPEVQEKADSARTESGAKIQAAIETIGTAKELSAKTGWLSNDLEKAAKILESLPEGDFKKQFAEKVKVESDEPGRAAAENRINTNTTLAGLHDVIGNGFWNLENKEGAKAIFQIIAKQGRLDEMLAYMSYDDQKEAINVLAKGKNVDSFSMAIAAKIYQNLSKVSNLDDDFKKDLRNRLEFGNSSTSGFAVDDKAFTKGLKYSLYNEKEAAATMIRAVMNNEVPAIVLGRFSGEEIKKMADLIGNVGGPLEREKFMAKLAQNSNQGIRIDTSDFSKSDQVRLIKEAVKDPQMNEGGVGRIVDQAGKKAVMDTVKKGGLDDKQLAVIGKHVNGVAMADEPEIAGKLLTAMIKTYVENPDSGPINLGNINKLIAEIDKDWWEDDDTMRYVLDELGDGPESLYDRFKKLAPAALDKIVKIAD